MAGASSLAATQHFCLRNSAFGVLRVGIQARRLPAKTSLHRHDKSACYSRSGRSPLKHRTLPHRTCMKHGLIGSGGVARPLKSRTGPRRSVMVVNRGPSMASTCQVSFYSGTLACNSPFITAGETELFLICKFRKATS